MTACHMILKNKELELDLDPQLLLDKIKRTCVKKRYVEADTVTEELADIIDRPIIVLAPYANRRHPRYSNTTDQATLDEHHRQNSIIALPHTSTISLHQPICVVWARAVPDWEKPGEDTPDHRPGTIMPNHFVPAIPTTQRVMDIIMSLRWPIQQTEETHGRITRNLMRESTQEPPM